MFLRRVAVCLVLILLVVTSGSALALDRSDPQLRADEIETFIELIERSLMDKDLMGTENVESFSTLMAILGLSGMPPRYVYYLAGYFVLPARSNLMYPTRDASQKNISVTSPAIANFIKDWNSQWLTNDPSDLLPRLKSLRDSGELYQDEYYYLMGYFDSDISADDDLFNSATTQGTSAVISGGNTTVQGTNAASSAVYKEYMNSLYAEIENSNYSYRGYVLRPSVLRDCEAKGMNFRELVHEIESKLISYKAHNEAGFDFAAVQMQKEYNNLNNKDMLKKAYLGFGKGWTCSFGLSDGEIHTGITLLLKEMMEGRDYIINEDYGFLPALYDEKNDDFTIPITIWNDVYSALPMVRCLLQQGKTVVLWCGQ